MQSLPTSEQVDTLHLLRLGGGAARPDLEAQVGAEAVSALVDDGLATATAARVSLTPAGRQAHEAALAADLDERGVRSHVDACYQRFLVLNAEVLALCTDWQVRTDGGAPAINDHSDPAYDDAVVARLGAVSAEAAAVLADLAGALPRLALYASDLASAAGRVRDGDVDYLTNPRVRCFHSTWFELHEDLLATLGIDRASEGEPAVAQ